MSGYRITVEELQSGAEPNHALVPVKVYEQIVPELDLRAVVNAVMQRKRGPRAAPKAKP